MAMVMVGNKGFGCELALDMSAPSDGNRELGDKKSEKVDNRFLFLECSILKSSTFPKRSVAARKACFSERPSSDNRSTSQYKWSINSALLDARFQPLE
jgi:hypothetical protein